MIFFQYHHNKSFDVPLDGMQMSMKNDLCCCSKEVLVLHYFYVCRKSRKLDRILGKHIYIHIQSVYVEVSYGVLKDSMVHVKRCKHLNNVIINSFININYSFSLQT